MALSLTLIQLAVPDDHRRRQRELVLRNCRAQYAARTLELFSFRARRVQGLPWRRLRTHHSLRVSINRTTPLTVLTYPHRCEYITNIRKRQLIVPSFCNPGSFHDLRGNPHRADVEKGVHPVELAEHYGTHAVHYNASARWYVGPGCSDGTVSLMICP